MSLESESHDRYRSLREKFFPVTRKPIYIPSEPVVVKRVARERMIELIDRQLAAERHPKPTPGRKKLFSTHQPYDPQQPVGELSPSEKEWRQRVRDVLVESNENLARLRSYNRDAPIVECRRKVAALLRDRGWSYPRIGRFLGRDHSSVISLLDASRGQRKYAKAKAKISVDKSLPLPETPC